MNENGDNGFKSWVHELVCKVMAPYNAEPTTQRHVASFQGIVCNTADYYTGLIVEQAYASDPQPLVIVSSEAYDAAKRHIEAVFALLMSPYNPTPFSGNNENYPTATRLTAAVIAEYIERVLGYKGWRAGKIHSAYPKLKLKAEKWVQPDDQYYTEMIAALPYQEAKNLKKRLDTWIDDYHSKSDKAAYEDIPKDDLLEYRGLHYMKGSVCDQIVAWSQFSDVQVKAGPKK